MSVASYVLNQTMSPRSVGGVMPAERPYEGVPYVVLNQPTQDVLTVSQPPKKPNTYQTAMQNRAEAPWWQRIGVDALILPTTMMAAGVLMAGVGKLPAVQKALEHPNPWVRFPAHIASSIAKWGIWEMMSEFLLIHFWK